MVRVGFAALLSAALGGPVTDIQPVQDLLQRVVGPGAAKHFDLALKVPGDWCKSPTGECVELSDGASGVVVVRGSSVGSLSFGVGIYLRELCHASLTSGKTGGLEVHACSQAPLPPVGESARVYSRNMRWTYYQNVVDSSYSFPWYDREKWGQEIDWMALTGVNLALMYTGQERVLRDTYAEFGVNLTNASGDADFFNGPAFLSWSRGQGMASVGGRDKFYNLDTGGSLPEWFLDSQVELGKWQAKRMRQLGITTILRGFEGNVPGQLKDLHPNASIHKASNTNFLLDALDPLFAQLADSYMRRLIAEFGTDHYYQADGLFSDKSGPWLSDQEDEDDHTEAAAWPDPDPSAAAHSAAAYAGLARTDPHAVWVYQTWIWRGYGDKNQAFLRGWISSIPKGRGLFLDQTAEWVPIWQKFSNWGFLDVPFIWCAMSNMGGNVGLFGDMTALATGPLASSVNSSFAGVGIDPEGVDGNPAYFHFILLSAWDSREPEHTPAPPANVTTWLDHWADMRCGKINEHARQAWRLLGDTVYKHDPLQIYEHHVAYCPTTMPEGSGWDRQHGAERPKWYAAATLHQAWGLLVQAAAECHVSDAFKFDLVDVGREYLSIEPCNAAFDTLLAAKTPTAIQQANASFSEFMVDLDRLLGSSNGFLLGQWVQQARSLASAAGAPDDEDFLEWNARSQVTSWYPSEACGSNSSRLDGLWDYGNKAWAGLVHGYYDKRMQIYADQKLAQLETGEVQMQSALQGAVMQYACEFQHSTEKLPATAQGDAVAIASEFLNKYVPAELRVLQV